MAFTVKISKYCEKWCPNATVLTTKSWFSSKVHVIFGISVKNWVEQYVTVCISFEKIFCQKLSLLPLNDFQYEFRPWSPTGEFLTKVFFEWITYCSTQFFTLILNMTWTLLENQLLVVKTVAFGHHFSLYFDILTVNVISQQRKGVKEKKCVTFISSMWRI